MEYQGVTGTIRVNETHLTIVRGGRWARWLSGHDPGPREIPLTTVAAVDFVGWSLAGRGFIHVRLCGAAPVTLVRRTALTHPDAVLFDRRHRAAFAELHTWLIGVAELNHREDLLVPAAAELLAPRRRSRDVPPTAPIEVRMRMRTAGLLGRLQGVNTGGAMFVGESREKGRNAIVALYPDRLEYTKPATFGAPMLRPKARTVLPTRLISRVHIARKRGWTAIEVAGPGGPIRLRLRTLDADHFLSLLADLPRGSAIALGATPARPDAPAPRTDVADQLARFAALRRSGVLTEEEFAAQQAKLLGH